MVSYGAQFSFNEVEVIDGLVNLNSVNNLRINNKSLGYQSSFKIEKNTIIKIDYRIARITHVKTVQELSVPQKMEDIPA